MGRFYAPASPAPHHQNQETIFFHTAEGDFDKFMDSVVYVYAPETMRIERIINRDKIRVEDVRLRLKHQWDDEKKISLSEHIVENEGKDLLIPQVLDIHNYYKTY